jgi:hypothetical protein
LKKKKKTNTPESSKLLERANTASVIESFLPAIAAATREAELQGNPRKHESSKP